MGGYYNRKKWKGYIFITTLIWSFIVNYAFATTSHNKPGIIKDVKVCLDKYCNKKATCLIDEKRYHIRTNVTINDTANSYSFCIKYTLDSLSKFDTIDSYGISTVDITFNKKKDYGSISVKLYDSNCNTLYHISGSTILPALENRQLTVRNIHLDDKTLYIDEKLSFSAEIENIQYNDKYKLSYICKLYIYNENKELLSEYILSDDECSKVLKGSIVSKNLNDLGITSLGRYYLELKVEGYFKQNKALINGITVDISNLDDWCKNILSARSEKIEFYVNRRPIPKLIISNLENNEYNFGKVEIGKEVYKTIVIKNVGNGEAFVEEINWIYNPNNAFVIVNNTCYDAISANNSCILDVAFKPKNKDFYRGNLLIKYNKDNILKINFTGEGVGKAKLTAKPNYIDFGKVDIYINQPVTKNIVLTNEGGEDVVIDDIIQDPETNFILNGEDNCKKLLNPGESCIFNISFLPDSIKLYESVIKINYHSVHFPQNKQIVTIQLRGEGYKSLSTIKITPSHLEFKDVTVNEKSKKSITIKGDRKFIIKDIKLYSDYFPPNPFGKFEINKGTCEIGKPIKECTLYIEFTPFYEASFEDELYIYFENALQSSYTVKITASSKCSEYSYYDVIVENQIDFGEVNIGESAEYTLNLKIQGNVEIGLESVKTGNPDIFKIVENTCPSPQNPSTTFNCNIKLRFTPTEEKTYTDKLELYLYYHDWCKNEGKQEYYEITLSGKGLKLNKMNPENPQKDSEDTATLFSIVYEDGVALDKLGKEDVLILYPQELKDKPILRIRLEDTDCENYTLRVYKIWESDEYCDALIEGKPSEPEYIGEDTTRTLFSTNSYSCSYEIKARDKVEAGLYSVILTNNAKSEDIELLRFNIYLAPKEILENAIEYYSGYKSAIADFIMSIKLPLGVDMIVVDKVNLEHINNLQNKYGDLCELRYFEDSYKSPITDCLSGAVSGAIIGGIAAAAGTIGVGTAFGAIIGAGAGCVAGTAWTFTKDFLFANSLYPLSTDFRASYIYLLSERDMLTLCSDNLSISFSDPVNPYIEIDVAGCIKEFSDSLNAKIYVYVNPIKLISTNAEVCELNYYVYDTETEANKEMLKINIFLNNSYSHILTTDIPVFKYFLIVSEKPLAKVIQSSNVMVDQSYYELLVKKLAYLNNSIWNTNLRILPNFFYALMLYSECKKADNICSIDSIYVPFRGFYPFEDLMKVFAEEQQFYGNNEDSTNILSLFLNHAYTMPVVVKYSGVLTDDYVEKVIGERKRETTEKLETISQNEKIIDVKIADPYMYIYTESSSRKKIYLLNLYTVSVDYEFSYKEDNSLEYAYLKTIYGDTVDITDKVCQENPSDEFSRYLQRFCRFSIVEISKGGTYVEESYVLEGKVYSPKPIDILMDILRFSIRLYELTKLPSTEALKVIRAIEQININPLKIRKLYTEQLAFKEKGIDNNYRFFLEKQINNIGSELGFSTQVINILKNNMDKFIVTLTKEKTYSDGTKLIRIQNNFNPSFVDRILAKEGVSYSRRVAFISKIYGYISHPEKHVLPSFTLKLEEVTKKEIIMLSIAVRKELIKDSAKVHTLFKSWKDFKYAFETFESKFDEMIEAKISGSLVSRNGKLYIKKPDGTEEDLGIKVVIDNNNVVDDIAMLNRIDDILNSNGNKSLKLEIELDKEIEFAKFDPVQSRILLPNIKSKTKKVIVELYIAPPGKKLEVRSMYPIP